MTIEKTDAHHHLWQRDSAHHPMLRAPDTERFFGNTGGLKHEFWADTFAALAAAQNVTRSIYVESHFYPPLAETAHIAAFARDQGFPHAIVGAVDLASPDLGAALDEHMRSPLFKGVRAMLNWDADPLVRVVSDCAIMTGPAWRAGYAELGRRGLSAEIMVTPAQLTDVAALASAIPGTPLVIGHAGLPLRRTPAEHALWAAGMAALAAMPHVHVKLSGFAMVDHHWTVDRIAPLVDMLIDLFTPQRAMFASNFPVDGLHKTYDEIWEAFDTITAHRSPADRDALFRDTARIFYGIA